MPDTYFVPIQDVYISSAYKNTNFFSPPQGEVLFVGSYTGINDIYRSLLKFDLFGVNGLIPNSTIRYAYLILYMYRNDNVGIANLNGYQLLNSFNEQTVTFNNAPLSNFPISGFSNGVYTPTSAEDRISIDVTRQVKEWYSGFSSNNGLELRGLENSDNNILGFMSTRFPNSKRWPKLLVGWSKGTIGETFTVLNSVPGFSNPIFMEGQEQVTFSITNNTTAPLVGLIQVSLFDGLYFANVPNTTFTVPDGETLAVSLSAAANYARVAILSGGIGSYNVKAMTRDE